MKKLLLLNFFCFTVQYIFAASVNIALPSKNFSVVAPNKKMAIDHDQQILIYSLQNNLTVKEYRKLSGKKLSLTQKVEYFLIRHKIIKPGPDNKGLINFGGFMLGYILGPIGILIAFIASKNKELRRWSIIGLGTLIVSIFIIVLTLSIGDFNWK